MLFVTYFAMISMSSTIAKSLSLVLMWDDIVDGQCYFGFLTTIEIVLYLHAIKVTIHVLVNEQAEFCAP